MLKAVDYFRGNDLDRNIGISIIEGLIKANKSNHNVIIPLLISQFTYLLIQLKDSSEIEERNVVRIYFLLKEFLEKKGLYKYKCELLDILDRKLENESLFAVNIPAETLKIWKKEIDSCL